MISPSISDRPLLEQAFALACETPPIFCGDTIKPFAYLGMGDQNDEQIGEMFEGKQVLDIGSGSEGIARRLFKIFGDAKLAPKVINLNPHLIEPVLRDRVLKAIEEDMRLGGEDFSAYMRQRTTVAGVVQDLPFEDGAFDIQTSTWGFPRCMFDCSDDYSIYSIDRAAHAQQGYEEILRTQAVGGIALLSPVDNDREMAATEGHLKALDKDHNFSHEFTPISPTGWATVLKIRKQ